MKVLKFFISVLAVLLMAVACGGNKVETTRISAVLNDSTITDVRIALASEASIDTTLAVVDGKFEFEVPTDSQSYGMIMMMVGNAGGKHGFYFIPDGNDIEITVGDEMVVKSAGDGVQSRYVAYTEALAELYASETAVDADLAALCMETIKANPDNSIAILALNDGMYSMTPDQMMEVISVIQEPVRSNEFIVSREEEVKAQMNTKEGMKFTDFTVEHVYGYDRSVDPQPLKKEVKFSDYVGKGKYVLVDFWSPWCGPCRREIPNIQKVYKEYKSKGLEVLSIAVWERKPQSHTIEVAAELGMDWLHINNAGSVPTDIYGINGIPHLMLIGPDGTILKRGFHGLEGIQNAVEEHIR